MKPATNKKGNQLKPRANPRSLEEWRQFRDEMLSRQRQANADLSTNAAERKRLACMATLGDAAAKSTIASRSANDAILTADLSSLADAIATADQAIASLEAEALQADRRHKLKALEEMLARRLELATAVEENLRHLAELLKTLGTTGDRIHAAHFELGGGRIILPPLAPDALASRLSEFLFGLGLAAWLPASCAPTKLPPSSFAAEERMAQSAYLLSA
jgi:hypothetical protein